MKNHAVQNNNLINLQLNHYKVKSRDEWIERMHRGAVAGDRWRDKLADFHAYDYNEVEETDILRFVPALKQRLE